jgi:hypothetical protein
MFYRKEREVIMAGKRQVRKSVRKGPENKQWAFLVYIAGDNNLSEEGLQDIQEMCKEGASNNVHVGVEIDTYGELTGSIRYEITERDWSGHAHRTVIERLPEKDSGDPRTLTYFLKWGLKRFPADNLIVVIWNHGAGFRSIRRDIGYDDFGSSLDMPEIERAFAQAGIGSKNKIAVLGFDACLMNMLEIVHHFKDQVDVVVGSQQTEPGDGWPYDKVLNQIKSCNSVSQLGVAIVKEYIKDYRRRGVYNVTQSAIETAKSDEAVKAVKHLGQVLAQSITNYRNDLREIRICCQSYEMADYVDLIHLAELIHRRINNASIASAAKAVIKSVRGCVISSSKYGSTVRESNGLSMWFPAHSGLYYNYRAKYLGLKCNETLGGWVKFLDAYHM